VAACTYSPFTVLILPPKHDSCCRSPPCSTKHNLRRQPSQLRPCKSKGCKHNPREHNPRECSPRKYSGRGSGGVPSVLTHRQGVRPSLCSFQPRECAELASCASWGMPRT
jgi:hypothetical protein